MRDFKKKTIALVLASVVTVAGSFSAEHYKNSLLGLIFEPNGTGVNLTLETKTEFSGSINTVKKDANTYVITLPEINSEVKTPDLQAVSSNVSSVDIRTMPYSNGSKGYTKITITTTPTTQLTTKAQVFIPAEDRKSLTHKRNKSNRAEKVIKENNNTPNFEDIYNSSLEESLQETELEQVVEEQEEVDFFEEEYYEEPAKEETSSKQNVSSTKKETTPSAVTQAKPAETIPYDSSIVSQDVYNDNSDNAFLLILSVLALFGLIAYFYVRAKNKLKDVVGENFQLNLNEESDTKSKKKSSKKIKKIKNTIKKLDETYQKSQLKPYSKSIEPAVEEPVESVQIETVNVVDLDELFKEKTQSNTDNTNIEDEENAALEDFLSGFSFDEELLNAELEAELNPGYDEEFYNEVINSNQTFTKDDMKKINDLLNSEILDSTLKNINNYAVSNPIKKVPSKKQILEDFVTNYSISQNITFTNEDVNALYKLISVEIDKDFLAGLKTDPERTKQMELDIVQAKPIRKNTENLTLKVKDFLPNLSEELKRHGNKTIESNAKPEVVYFSEGYEVQTLTIGLESLPNLETAIHNTELNNTRHSQDFDLVDNSYEVARLNISSELPSIEEMVKNPDKYGIKKPEENFIPDENKLLDNITNVTFKPFDADKTFDKINEDSDDIMLDSKEDLNSIDNEPNIENNKIELEFKQNKSSKSRITNNNIERVKNIIQEKKKSHFEQNSSLDNSKQNLKDNIETKVMSDIKCIYEGITYSVISKSILQNDIGCYLAKSENDYIVFGYQNDTLTKLKQYNELKSEKIQARLSEVISDDTNRYLVRIGINKFVVDVVNNEEIKYIIDLC